MSLRTAVALSLVSATIVARLSAQTPPPATALAHVTVIDGTGAAPQRDMTVVIRNGVIAALFRSGSDALMVIRWKDIYEGLEEAIDACENAADVLETIVVKNR